MAIDHDQEAGCGPHADARREGLGQADGGGGGGGRAGCLVAAGLMFHVSRN